MHALGASAASWLNYQPEDCGLCVLTCCGSEQPTTGGKQAVQVLEWDGTCRPSLTASPWFWRGCTWTPGSSCRSSPKWASWCCPQVSGRISTQCVCMCVCARARARTQARLYMQEGSVGATRKW